MVIFMCFMYLSDRGDRACLAVPLEGACNGPFSSDDALEARLTSTESTKLPRFALDGSFISTEPLEG